MKSNWRVTWFKPVRAGVVRTENSVSFAAELSESRESEECGVILVDHEGESHRIPFRQEGRRGSLYGLKLEGEDPGAFSYNFYQGDKIITDPYACQVLGLETWGEQAPQEREGAGDGQGPLGERQKRICAEDLYVRRRTSAFLGQEPFDWQGDEPLKIPLEESIIYGLNVRGFTMHKSAGVKARGTFEGLIEKLPYLTRLGITAVELMPCYEYDECMAPRIPFAGPENVLSALAQKPSHEEGVAWKAEAETPAARLNCWGFQKGFYFAPKASYSAEGKPVASFKRLVREFHKKRIEILMHFYFPQEIRQIQILEVIRHWVIEYHIDGVRLSGFHIPFRLIAEDPVLRNTKIRCSYVPGEDLSVVENPSFKNFITDNGNFRNDMRRFLKGDEGLINQALSYQRRNPRAHGVVNFMADYDGFSLYDSVCYERRHNEANGEDNRDGAELNYTWNCGVEGESRKKGVQELRLRQIKNALSFVFLSQGVPFLFGGDEFASSRQGNNNCYSQDNETGWVNWKKNSFAREVLDYTEFLIRLRRENAILHMKEELLVMDSIGCGYPDISYHGIEAWRPDLSFISRIVGIMLCGQYAPGGKESLYIVCNMHWESHKLALPRLGRNKKWEKIADTSMPSSLPAGTQEGEGTERQVQEESVITVCSRSVAVFRTVKRGKIRDRKRKS